MQSFLNNPRAEMRYARGRMFTRRSPDGDGYQLVAYGHNVLAEVTENSVDFYTAYYGVQSQTVTKWVALFGSVLSNTDGFEVTIHDSAKPNTGIGNLLADAAQYIDSYVGDFTSAMSDVEEQAVSDVERACLQAYHDLTGE